MSQTTEAVLKVANIIVERDNMPLEDAIELVESTLAEIAEIDYEPEESEEIWMNNLGLEADYLFDYFMS